MEFYGPMRVSKNLCMRKFDSAGAEEFEVISDEGDSLGRGRVRGRLWDAADGTDGSLGLSVLARPPACKDAESDGVENKS